MQGCLLSENRGETDKMSEKRKIEIFLKKGLHISKKCCIIYKYRGCG